MEDREIIRKSKFVIKFFSLLLIVYAIITMITFVMEVNPISFVIWIIPGIIILIFMTIPTLIMLSKWSVLDENSD